MFVAGAWNCVTNKHLSSWEEGGLGVVVVEFNPFTPMLQIGDGASFIFLNMWALGRLRSVRIVSLPQPAVQTPIASLRLQALVYDILPSTTAVSSYAIGSRKLSASEQFFCWCSNSSSKFVTNNSDYIRRLFYNRPCCLRQLK